MTRSGTLRGFAAAALFSLIAFLGSGALSGAEAGTSAVRSGATPPARSAPPFARVYLALRGCTSCSHCRMSIRQMVRANSKGGEAAFGDDQVEVRYATPRTVPLREVIQSLAQNRLHDLTVVDVLFDATGTVALGSDGARRFVLAGTGQSFPLTLPTGVLSPAPGSSVRVVALVEGWRTKGKLSLLAREVHGSV